MQDPQLELWSAEPHPTPLLFQQLTPSQRERLIERLAQLMLKGVQQNLPLPNPTPTDPIQNHER
jgi:hypothetical protein